MGEGRLDVPARRALMLRHNKTNHGQHGRACAGVGTIFGHYLAAALRNPSAAQGQFGNLIFGFAVTEALGIFSFVIALLPLFAL